MLNVLVQGDGAGVGARVRVACLFDEMGGERRDARERSPA